MKLFSVLAFLMSLTSCVKFSQKLTQWTVKNTMGFDYEDSEKWGKVVTRQLDLPAFTAIDATGTVKVILMQDSVPSIRVCSNEKCIDAYDFEVQGNELNVNLKDNSDNETPAITIYASVPAMEEIDIDGSGAFVVQGTVVQDAPMVVRIDGAGKVEIESLHVRSLDMDFSGAADVNISEVVAQEDAKIEVSGAGNIVANVFCRHLSVEVNGAGSALLTGECEQFTAEENGVSNIDFSGLKRGVEK